jgi:hypothetical protein
MAEETTSMPSAEYLVSALAGARRRSRQEAAHHLALMAHEDASQLLPYAEELIDALYRPEAQTRWEVFDALSEVAQLDADAVAEGYDGAEASLFDEDSAKVRLGAFRFLCRLIVINGHLYIHLFLFCYHILLNRTGVSVYRILLILPVFIHRCGIQLS